MRTETSLLLELFDNPELELKTPEQWLTKGPTDAAEVGQSKCCLPRHPPQFTPSFCVESSVPSLVFRVSCVSCCVGHTGHDLTLTLTRRAGSFWPSVSAPGVMARSRYYTQFGQFAWEPCYVTGYNAEDGTYSIVWKHTLGGAEADHTVSKSVKRLNLIFDSEDSAQFRTRLATAMAMREQTEVGVCKLKPVCKTPHSLRYNARYA